MCDPCKRLANAAGWSIFFIGVMIASIVALDIYINEEIKGNKMIVNKQITVPVK